MQPIIALHIPLLSALALRNTNLKFPRFSKLPPSSCNTPPIDVHLVPSLLLHPLPFARFFRGVCKQGRTKTPSICPRLVLLPITRRVRPIQKRAKALLQTPAKCGYRIIPACPGVFLLCPDFLELPNPASLHHCLPSRAQKHLFCSPTPCKQASSCAAYIRHLLTPHFHILLIPRLLREIVRQIMLGVFVELVRWCSPSGRG